MRRAAGPSREHSATQGCRRVDASRQATHPGGCSVELRRDVALLFHASEGDVDGAPFQPATRRSNELQAVQVLMPEQQLEDEQFLRRKGEKTRVRPGHGLQSYIQVRLMSNPREPHDPTLLVTRRATSPQSTIGP